MSRTLHGSLAGFTAAAAVAVSLLQTSPASAFCRTTTCDVTDTSVDCRLDRKGCATAGVPLYWKEGCLSFSVQKDGSPRRGISYDEFDEAVQAAFHTWVNAPCEGGKPSFKIWDFGPSYGPSECNKAEYNRKAANANIWMFRDDGWQYPGANVTLALTTVSFEVATGRILDADVEMNSRFIEITTSDEMPSADLQSIATHEAGHFLGLAHSNDDTATMYAAYDTGDLGFRELKPDDVDGICTIYPPDRVVDACSSPVPMRGFSQICGGADPVIPDPTAPKEDGCGIALAAGSSSRGAVWALAALVAGAGISRRRLRRQS